MIKKVDYDDIELQKNKSSHTRDMLIASFTTLSKYSRVLYVNVDLENLARNSFDHF